MSRKITEKVIGRLRAVPRVVSLSGDIGFSTPLEEDYDSVRITKPAPEKRNPSPKVIFSANCRPEITSELSVTVFTSVSKSDETSTIPRIKVPRNNSGLRVGPIEIKRLNSDGNITHSTRDDAPNIDDDFEMLETLSKNLLDGGIILNSGQHLFIDLEESSMDNSKTISIEGDQAVRIAFTTNSGHLISSSEIPQHLLPQEVSIPVNSRIIHLFGFGDIANSSTHLQNGSNTISLNCSTDNTTAVGFQAHSRILGVPNTLLVCRGGVVRFDHLAIHSQKTIRARELLKKAKAISFDTGIGAETFIAIVNSNAVESARFSNSGVEMDSPQQSVTNGALTAMIWKIPISDYGINKFTVSTKLEGSVHSLMAMKGKPENWTNTMQNQYWDTIVEEGALTNKGSCLIKISSMNNGEVKEEVKDNAGK